MERANAVRAVITHVKNIDRAVVGMAPEGMDFPGGRLGIPPAGVGRFMLHLSHFGLVFVPVGVFEMGEHFCIQFGPQYHLETPAHLPSQERDRMASRIVMSHIADLLPTDLHGEFGANQSN